MLDLGCGSGILSIAALCLGASHAAAVDIDPKAVDVAYENAALNGIGRDRYTVPGGQRPRRPGPGRPAGPGAVSAGAGQHRGRRDHPPVRPGAPLCWTPEGVFLCSGIIDTRADEVAAALEAAGLAVTGRREKNGWVALEARLG